MKCNKSERSRYINVKKEILLNTSFKSPEIKRQPNMIATIIIIPRNKPDKINPPGMLFSLKSRAVKSPIDKIPNIIFNLRSVVIIAGNLYTTSNIYNFTNV